MLHRRRNPLLFIMAPHPCLTNSLFFDIVVIDPGSAADLKNHSVPPDSVYAYVSLGAVRKDDPLSRELDKSMDQKRE